MSASIAIHPSKLSPADIAAWRGMQDATPAFASPLLGPDFALAVGAVRDDARVAVLRDHDATAAAFLAFHQRPGRFARPIGAPFCDYHALVSLPGLTVDGGDMLETARLGSLRLSGLVDPLGVFRRGVEHEIPAHRIILAGAPQPYLDQLATLSGNRFKNYRRYHRRLEQDVGALAITAPDHDLAAFEQMISWKRAQFARTGTHDVLGPAWSAALMRRMFDQKAGQPLEGLMISLYAGERLVAAHFGVRLKDWFHPWISAHDPELKAYSPGLLFQIRAIEAMPGLGLRTYDLGPGSDPWKSMFALNRESVGAGLATAASFSGGLARSWNGVWALQPLRRAPMVGRIRNRLEQIAAVEPTMRGRLHGAAHAIAAFPRRPQDGSHSQAA